MVLADAGIPQMSGKAFRKGAGCTSCHDSGFQGRMGIYECMEVTPELRRLIYRNAPTHQLRGLLHKQGQLSLREEGVRLAIEQHTSLEEVIRVTQVDDNEGDEVARPVGTGGVAA
jgi:type II secretory ATPase GspE/PulE/Tfp pilus assembly ATPase PilB-like protein